MSHQCNCSCPNETHNKAYEIISDITNFTDTLTIIKDLMQPEKHHSRELDSHDQTVKLQFTFIMFLFMTAFVFLIAYFEPLVRYISNKIGCKTPSWTKHFVSLDMRRQLSENAQLKHLSDIEHLGFPMTPNKRGSKESMSLDKDSNMLSSNGKFSVDFSLKMHKKNLEIRKEILKDPSNNGRMRYYEDYNAVDHE